MASHCRKLVDSLAPSVTTILCEGKQLSIGVFGHEEVTVSSPLSPAEISKLLYTPSPTRFLPRLSVTSLTKCTDPTTGQTTLALLTLLDNETFRLSL